MALANIDIGVIKGKKPSAPLFAINVEFDGDDAYPTGGTAAFTESIRDTIETEMKALADANVRGRTNITIIGVAGFEAGQYVPSFDIANDKLFVRDGGHATWAEVTATTDLSGTTFKLTLLCY